MAHGDERRQVGAALVALVAGLLVIGVAAALHLSTRPSPGAVARAPVEPAVPASAEVRGGPPAPPPRARAVTGVAFEGSVRGVTGRDDVRAGAPCTVLVAAPRGQAQARLRELLVRCGEVELLRLTRRAPAGVAPQEQSLEVEGDEPDRRWTLRFRDVGAREAGDRPQAEIDTAAGTGRVFTLIDGEEPMAVDIAIRPGGAAISGPLGRTHVSGSDANRPLLPKRPKVVGSSPSPAPPATGAVRPTLRPPAPRPARSADPFASEF
jgi:hypothetical protein